MKPAGVILTYMVWKDWKQWWFNIPLLIGQLAFMIVGTAYGKIKWPDKKSDYVDSIILTISWFSVWGCICLIYFFSWYYIPIIILHTIITLAFFRNIDWRKVWRSAQCSHVRLCLGEYFDYFKAKLGELERSIGLPSLRDGHSFRYINFGYPKAKMDYWRMDQCKGQFRYFEPTFDPSPKFIAAMIEYAEAQVGKPYDTLQLFSYGLNFIVWLFWWKKWGREVFRWLNLRGGREVCSSGAIADLRWADWKSGGLLIGRFNSRFFNIYDTAMVMPCMFAIDRNWEVT